MSYAHTDEAVATRLHRALETYPIPKSMALKDAANEPKKLSPIFRDADELTAHHSLSEKIRQAVASSRFLIVLCSPAAKVSHWVNEEIRLFRGLHGEESILCVLADGTPETSFPAALTEDGREPLAANLGGNKESFNLGVTQLAASMLGVGLDQLIQRDAKRRRNRFRLLTAASLSFAAIMGGMAWMAIDARDSAETSRSEAENMVEYMITDLKKELDAVGRLSILDDVGTRVTDYYNAIPLSDMDDERLTRQARARHILGEVAVKQGQLDHALTELTAAYAATEEYLRRNPNNPEAIFAHAQSEYWIGKVYLERKEPEKALPSRLAYSKLSKQLYDIDPDNRDYVFEYGWAENNLGYLYRRVKMYDLAETHYNSAIKIFEIEKRNNPDDQDAPYEIASIQRNLAITNLKSGNVETAKSNLLQSIQILSNMHHQAPENLQFLDDLTTSQLWLQEIFILENTCGESDIQSVVENHKILIKRDPENEIWNKSYLHLIHIISENCAGYFKTDWLQNEVENALSAYSRIETKDQLILKKGTWLRDFQAKLNTK